MSTLEKALRWLIIGGIFALTLVPFIVSASLFFPYITGKNFAFRIIVEIIGGAWLTLALLYPQYRPRRSWIFAAFALFVLVIGVADAFGVYPFKSFWSNYERMDGWVTLAHLLVYLYVAASMMTTEVLWRRLFQTSLALSACLAVYGFLQVAGISALGAGGAAGLTARIDATFGNPIYLAVYMLFHIFIAVWLWSQMWEERGHGKRLPLSLLYALVIGLDVVALFFTGTRGTMIGLVGGTLLSAFLLVLFARPASGVARTSPVAWRIAVGYVVFIVVVAGSFWAVRDAAWVERVGFLNRLATISTSDNPVKARFINWSIAWQGVKERPILGWGQENYAIVFDKYYDPRMYAQEQWFDRVHNIIFDWLVAGGFLGLLSYLSIFAAALFALWRPSGERGSTEASAPNVKGRFSLFERALFTGLLAGYFFHNFFVFDNITSYILFASVLAYIAWRTSSEAPLLWSRSLPETSAPFVAVVAALLVWVLSWFVNTTALAQNKTLLQALAPHPEGLSKNLEYITNAIGKGTYGTQEAREQLSQIASKVASISGVDAKTKQDFYTAAITELDAMQKDSSQDARFPLFQGIVHESFGNYSAGAQSLERARELSPKKQTILFSIASNKQSRGDSAGALATYAEALELEPGFVQARILYASALIHAGNLKRADEVLEPIIATGEAADPRIAAAYLVSKRYDKIANIWEAHMKAQPKDVQGYFTLAAAYYGMGERAKAISALEAAVVVEPSLADQVKVFIEQVRNGTAQI
ncbi:MAG: O-antigen ligase family protein [bacterium]|nr:O-antigen ligase family protein [bacterium]